MKKKWGKKGAEKENRVREIRIPGRESGCDEIDTLRK